jgi:hypothetical protein
MFRVSFTKPSFKSNSLLASQPFYGLKKYWCNPTLEFCIINDLLPIQFPILLPYL